MILIDISLPDNCLECPLHNEEYGYCNVDRNFDIGIFERPRSCPIIEERKKGKWDVVDYEYPLSYKLLTCSVCGKRLFSTDIPKYCQFCGSLMDGD